MILIVVHKHEAFIAIGPYGIPQFGSVICFNFIVCGWQNGIKWR